MSQNILVLINGYDPGWLRIAEQIITTAISQGETAWLLDASSISTTPPDSYDRRVLRLANIHFPGHDIEQRMLQLGANYLNISTFAKSPNRAPLSEVAADALEISTTSALITYYRTDSPDLQKRKIKATYDGFKAEGINLYWAMKQLLTDHQFTTVYLPNGRFPNQRMPMLAAQELNVSTVHFEKGESANSAYLQPYSPQDRINSQNSVGKVLSGLTRKEIENIADDWIARRAPAKTSINEFSEGWKQHLDSELLEKIRNHKTVGLFTSSQDEFMFLGPEWQLHTWESQFQAFDTILNLFEKAGYFCYLRVHPNLATKEHGCFKREKNDLHKLISAHPKLYVIWHDEPVNSYFLLEHTDQVVVWDSTIGLEANAIGIPVIACATTRYGLVADVQEILGKESATSQLTSIQETDSYKAKKFIAYLNKRDISLEIPANSWIPWAKTGPSFLVKLSTFTVSGGAPTIRDSLRATLDLWRHRRMSFNISMINKKIKALISS